MPPFEDEDTPTLREISRTVRDFRDEFRLQMGMMVRKDVHAVEHSAMELRCQNIESRMARMEGERDGDKKDRTTIRNQYYFSVVGAVLSLVVALVVAAVK